jgi:formate hydrogenlyase subunit 3/multisubunit Na+/H+ antiporter MnhD subunit
MSTVYAAGMLLLAVSVLLPVLDVRLGLLTAAAGSALLAAVGIAAAGRWAGAGVDLGGFLGFGDAHLRADGLAGIFLALVGGTGAAVSLALLERRPARLAGGLHALILLSVATVVGVDQAFVFLLAWETITLSLYLLAASGRERPGALLSAYFGGSLSKLGGACLLAAFALLYGRTGSFELHAWATAGGLGAARSVAFCLLLVGFGSKIGLVPSQAGLPPLYAAAPAATAATIAIAYDAGFYGLWRLCLQTLGPGPGWWGELVLVLGAVTALVGILYAVAQDELVRFLGYSSVEHGGIVLLGFGVALLGGSAHEPKLAAAGLLAATMHLIMHGVAKPLAFLAADRVAVATGERELRPLGGLAPRLPRTAVAFGLAVLSLAAMPPFGGFVSEWLTFEALLQSFRLDSTVARLVMALAAAILALTAGIGLLAFAKLYGGAFLGRARSALAELREPGPSLGVAALAGAALVLGPVAPWEIRWLGRGLESTLGFDPAGSTISFPLVLGPVYRDFSVLAPTWLALGIPAFVLTAALLVRVLLRPAVRRAPVWLSGTAPDAAVVQYTPDSYANPIRVVLSSAYRFRRAVVAIPGTTPPRWELRTEMTPAFEAYLYAPVTRAALRLSSQARRLQSGRLGTYLLYVLVVLLAALALIPALHER